MELPAVPAAKVRATVAGFGPAHDVGGGAGLGLESDVPEDGVTCGPPAADVSCHETVVGPMPAEATPSCTER